MAFKLNPGAAEHHYNLEGNLDFETAANALSVIGEKLAQADHLSLDLSRVSTANSAGLALLVECKAMALQAGKSITIQAIPESLQRVAQVCQVQELLA